MKKLLLLITLLMPATLWADSWVLDADQSDLQVVSIKKGKVAEVHHFTALNGGIEQNRAHIVIDLNSVESGIAIRNTRMKSMLFETSRFSSALISADLSGIDYASLQVGQSRRFSLPLTLDLHGVKNELTASVNVVALADQKLLVVSQEPVIVKASEFELEAGIEALRQVAKLPSIAVSVPVTFSLQFSR